MAVHYCCPASEKRLNGTALRGVVSTQNGCSLMPLTLSTQFARIGSNLSSSCDSLSLGAESFEEDEGGEDGSFANDKLCSGSLDSGLDSSFRPTAASQC